MPPAFSDLAKKRGPKKTSPPHKRKRRPSEKQAPRRLQGPGLDTAKQGLWLWGWHTVCAALANPQRGKLALYVTEKRKAMLIDQGFSLEALCPHHVVTADTLDQRLPGEALHQGIALQAQPLTYPLFKSWLHDEGRGTLLALDQICDPQNIGALARSTCALGGSGLILPQQGAPALDGALAKAAAGALEHVPVFLVTNLSQSLLDAKEAGFWVSAISEDGQSPEAWTPSINHILVLGAEGKGLRPLVKQRCDQSVCLPTAPSFSTLNVSVAGALALYMVKAKQSG
ncbi:TrmH family RNA methyltransferase [Candidatus Hepatobacter penaei]|uniref:TrmH family RNA methyltransferase n=1 Tax=Candidatus Hepatobacter penaei TaxID=1274402 RepID=UPI0006978659|nr:RNA methyltransferase [Candidatus Hepatobacter penaei]